MKKIALSDSEKKLLLVAMALGMLACAYFFGFVKMMDSAKAIEESNVQDQATVTNLENMVAKQPQTVAETQAFKDYIQTVIDKYPSDLKQEKTIWLVQQMEEIVGVDYSSISFSIDNLLMDFTGAEENPTGYYAALSLPYKADYEQFKNLIQYVSEQKDRTTIPLVSVSFDESTGFLNGAVTFRMYYLRNTGKDYEDFPETGIESGLTNIFYNTGE